MALYLLPQLKSFYQPRTISNIFAKLLTTPTGSFQLHRVINTSVSSFFRPIPVLIQLSTKCLLPFTQNTASPEFGFMFDIDGVLVRGKEVIPAAIESFKKLVDQNGKFRIPVIFVTNAGNNLRCQKADKLTNLLGVKVVSCHLT